MLRKSLILAWPLLLSCSTLTSNQAPKEYAPVNSKEAREGTVFYNPEGFTDIVTVRRNDAFKKIVGFCGAPKYKITKEETVPAKTNERTSFATIGADTLRKIYFVCE